MSRRYLVTTAVSACLAATALAGCFRADEDPHSLDVLVAANAQYPQQQRQWFAHVARTFKQQTGATVHFETYADINDEETKLETSAVTSTGPDVYFMGTTFTPLAAATKAFITLSEQDWRTIGGRNRFFDRQRAMSGPDRAHQIGVPMSMRPYGLVYNTAMFRAAGIDGPPSTWDELVADARKLNRPRSGVYGVAVDYADTADPWKYVWTLTRQAGGDFVSRDLTTARLGSPVVRRAVTDYFGLLTRERVVDPHAAGWAAPDALGAFADGKAAMLPMVTPSALPSLQQAKAVRGKYRFASLPLVPFGHTTRPPGGVAAGTIVSGDNLAVADYSPRKQLALRFIAMITGAKEQTHYSQVFGDIPANQAAATGLARNNAQLRAFIAAESRAVPTAFTSAWADIQLALQNVVVQSRPQLSAGRTDEGRVRSLLAAANHTADRSLDRDRS